MSEDTNKFERWLREKSVQEVELLVPDIGGIPRGKILPVKSFIKGLKGDSHRLAQAVFIQTISGEYASDVEELGYAPLPKSIFNPSEIDVTLAPDFKTLRMVPWYPDPTAQVICDAKQIDGKVLEYSSRDVLRRILKLYDGLGIEPILAPEMEFYLIKQNDDADYPLEVPTGLSGRREAGSQSYGIDAVNEFDTLFDSVYNYCEIQKIGADTLNHEDGSAQMEINLNHGKPSDLADQVFLFKRTLKQTAIRNQLHATFMAKPMEDQPGSSMHIHQSLYGKKNKNNLFSGKSKNGSFSDLMMNYIGGLQKYTPALMPIYAPSFNSYRRLIATWGTPTNTHWGVGNRSCGFRIPNLEKQNMRIENRIAGSDTNPYLIFAATLAAGYLGIKNKISPTSETKESLYEKKSTTLPHTMEASIAKFEQHEEIINIFGDKLVKTVAAIRRVEYEAYLDVISSWEREHLLLNV